MSIKVYLDDIRPAPEGWVKVLWPDHVIALLKTGNVDEISLDHDLGNDLFGTGYDVLLWIENEVVTNNFQPPIIRVHSANGPAYDKMTMAVLNIRKLASKSFEKNLGR